MPRPGVKRTAMDFWRVFLIRSYWELHLKWAPTMVIWMKLLGPLFFSWPKIEGFALGWNNLNKSIKNWMGPNHNRPLSCDWGFFGVRSVGPVGDFLEQMELWAPPYSWFFWGPRGRELTCLTWAVMKTNGLWSPNISGTFKMEVRKPI